MLYEDLQKRYGSHVAKRVKRELGNQEFSNVALDRLHAYLEARAEKVAQDYKSIMENPLERGNVRSELLHQRWHDAENLAYLISVAEDVSLTVRAELGAI